MGYDFETHVSRENTGSAKWDAMYRRNPRVGHEIVPLSVADMELPNPPEVIDALRSYLDDAILGYTEPTDAFYDACIGWQARHHGWTPARAWLVTSPGVVPAIFNAVSSLTEEGDGVIIQPPVYYPFRMAVERTGRTLVTNPLRRVELEEGGHSYEMDFEDLAQKAADPRNRMLVLCSPHNPVGRVWRADELRRLLDICVQNDVIVVSDEIHDDLVMPGHAHTTIMRVAEAGEYDHILVCTAPSKTFNLAGCQASAIYIPDEALRERFEEGFAKVALRELNAFAYVATQAAYTRCDEWLDQLIELVWSNYRMLRGFLAAYLPEVELYPLEGTYLAWLDFGSWGLSKEELEAFMCEEALLFPDEGSMFGHEGDCFERLNLACPTDVLEAALERLVHAARERRLGAFSGGDEPGDAR